MIMEKRYTILENIKFTMSSMWKYESHSFFYLSFIQIVLTIGTTFYQAVLPSFVIKKLSSDIMMKNILIDTALFVALLLSGKIILSYVTGYCNITANFLRQHMSSVVLSGKLLDTDFMNLEGSKNQNDIEKAFNAVYSGNEIGFERFAKDIVLLIISIICLVLYSVITAEVNFCILLILLFCSILTNYINKANINWVEHNKDRWISYDKKIRYIKNQCSDLKNGKDIRLFNIKSWFIDIYLKLISKRMYWIKKEQLRYFYTHFAERTITMIKDLISYGYLIYRVFHGMDIASFVMYIAMVAGLNTFIKDIFDIIMRMQSNNIVINDFRNLMEKKDKTNRHQGIPIPKNKTHSITLKNVSFTYPGAHKPVINNLNLTINSGEKVALVGMNGAGKTTLIKLICGLYTPDSGEILIDGINISYFNIFDLFNELSVVFQDVFVFAFTIAQNIACAKEADIDYEKIDICLKKAGLLKKINSLKKGVHTKLLKVFDEDGILLSGGELQKLMLARALYKDASIIILDEPTAALDPIAESQMYEKYNSLILNKTSIFISHRLSSTRFCDRILFMNQGTLVEDGNHEELMKLKGAYFNMYKLQAHYYQEEVKKNAAV